MIEEFHHLEKLKKQTVPFTIKEKGGRYFVHNAINESVFRKKYDKQIDPKIVQFYSYTHSYFAKLKPEISTFPSEIRELFSRQYEGNVYMVDIKNAYWEAALKLGYITPRIYQRGMEFNKIDRLKCLGMTKKPIYTWHYHGDKLISQEIENNPKSFIYDNCANFINLIMKNIASESNGHCLAYFVDCLFFNSETEAKKAETKIKEIGLDSHIKTCEGTIQENKLILYPEMKKYMF